MRAGGLAADEVKLGARVMQALGGCGLKQRSSTAAATKIESPGLATSLVHGTSQEVWQTRRHCWHAHPSSVRKCTTVGPREVPCGCTRRWNRRRVSSPESDARKRTAPVDGVQMGKWLAVNQLIYRNVFSTLQATSPSLPLAIRVPWFLSLGSLALCHTGLFAVRVLFRLPILRSRIMNRAPS